MAQAASMTKPPSRGNGKVFGMSDASIRPSRLRGTPGNIIRTAPFMPTAFYPQAAPCAMAERSAAMPREKMPALGAELEPRMGATGGLSPSEHGQTSRP